MKKRANFNRPAKGARITVEPIREVTDIKAILELLKNKPRDYLLFTMGINNGLRSGDLLKLKVKDVKHLKPGNTITIREQKTRKDNYLVINHAVYKAIKVYLGSVILKDSDYLFVSRKGNGPLTISSVNNLVKKWADSVNLLGNYGAHSLRKTWGYIQRTVHNVSFEVICKRFNHSNPSITMRYLGIQDSEVNAALMNQIG